MRTASRQAKAARRWEPTIKNAHRENDSGCALRPGADGARFVLSKRPLAGGRLVKLNQPNDPVSLAPAPTFYPTSRVLSRPHLSPVSVGLRNIILETDIMTKQSASASSSESIVVDAPHLAGAVLDMATLVEEYSLQIQAVARSGYLSLETPWGVGDTETLANLLSLIENLAANLNDGVAFSAGQVLITPRDDRQEARHGARMAKWNRNHGGDHHGS